MVAAKKTRRRGRLLLPLVLLCYVAWSVGQFALDRFWWTGICFYIPSPLVALACLLLFLRTRRRIRWMALALALFPAYMTAVVENHFDRRSQASSETSLRMVHWNVGFSNFSDESLHRLLEDLNADLYIFSEAPGDTDPWAQSRPAGKGWETLRYKGMLVTARGTVRVVQPLELKQGFAALLEWKCDGRPVTILIADLPSSLLLARDPMLADLQRLLIDHKPDLLVGDFNAPRRSRRLAELPNGYVHAYDAAGSGWSYSFPVPCPMWAIDQCIVGPKINPLHHELRSSLHTDHRLQLFDFDVVNDG